MANTASQPRQKLGITLIFIKINYTSKYIFLFVETGFKKYIYMLHIVTNN